MEEVGKTLCFLNLSLGVRKQIFESKTNLIRFNK